MADTNETSLAGSELIRTGRDGRQRYSEDYKRQVLEAFESSSMSGKAFAEQCGIKYPTFAAWLAKRRRKANTNEADATTDTPAFLLAQNRGQAKLFDILGAYLLRRRMPRQRGLSMRARSTR